MKPFYDAGGIRIYHSDVRSIFESLEADVMVTDPPYGIAHNSKMGSLDRRRRRRGVSLPGIVGDDDLSLRDWVLSKWTKPALVFGTWKRPRPAGTKALLTWEKGMHVGMGDSEIPWKPNTEEIYVLGKGFHGFRGSSVLKFDSPVSWNSNGRGGRDARIHGNQKPIALMSELLSKCPPGVVIDPFAGSGSTLVAAKCLGRSAIGIEIEERYCEQMAIRLEATVEATRTRPTESQLHRNARISKPRRRLSKSVPSV